MDVHRRWPSIAASAHLRARGLSPFVTRAIQDADERAPNASGLGTQTLELRDDLMLGAAPLGGRSAPAPGPSGDETDPRDVAVLQAFRDLSARERALVALSVYAGLPDSDLPWAVRWRPPRAALVARRAVRDLMLTAAPVVIGQAGDPLPPERCEPGSSACSPNRPRRSPPMRRATASTSGLDR